MAFPLNIRGKSRRGGSVVPTANLAAWYQKAIGITQAGGFVSQWADQSGNARHLKQATGANQPTTDGSTLTFDGLAQFLKTDPFTLNQPCTIYLRMKQITWTNNTVFFDGNVAFGSLSGPRTATPGIYQFAGGVGNVDNNLAVNTWGSVAEVFNGASSLIQVGANATTTSNAGAANFGGFTLGAAASGANFSNIQVAELLIYSAAHNQSQRDALVAYLNTK